MAMEEDHRMRFSSHILPAHYSQQAHCSKMPPQSPPQSPPIYPLRAAYMNDEINSISAHCDAEQMPSTALPMAVLGSTNNGCGIEQLQVEPGESNLIATNEGTPLTRRVRRRWSTIHQRPPSLQYDGSSCGSGEHGAKSCRKTCFIVDPSAPLHYKWLSLVTSAILYNLIFVVGRAVFWELGNALPTFWYTLDYTADSIYILDTIIHAHEGYLDQGLMVRDPSRLRRNYFSSASWRTDILSCLPTDIVYFYWSPSKCNFSQLPCPVIVRVNRLFRIPRMLEFFDRTETRTGYPNVFRICKVFFSIIILIHWNSCFYFAISYIIGFGTDGWVFNIRGPQNSTLSRQYIYCFYWSTLTLTTIGETPQPENDAEYLFVVADFLAGVLIFATIVGNIGSMISNMNVARVEFQNRMDGVKQYMAFRRVSRELEARVIRWFAYTWANKQVFHALDEDRVLAALPDKLKAEIAIHVHLDTLKKVRIFQDCEPGLLEELVLKLRLQVFSPGDYICRKGDVGKEMYIVKRGRLSVVADDERTVLATLSAGSVFGEVSVLDIAGNKTGNRRTANVRSIGYSDLFCLAKKDLWDTLTDYPEARHSLMERGCQLLRKDRLLDEEIFKNAQLRQESIQDRVERLDKTIETFQQQMAELIAEQAFEHTKLLQRMSRLEEKKDDDSRECLSSPSKSEHPLSPNGMIMSPKSLCSPTTANFSRFSNKFGRHSLHATSRTWARRRSKTQSSI